MWCRDCWYWAKRVWFYYGLWWWWLDWCTRKHPAKICWWLFAPKVLLWLAPVFCLFLLLSSLLMMSVGDCVHTNATNWHILHSHVNIHCWKVPKFLKKTQLHLLKTVDLFFFAIKLNELTIKKVSFGIRQCKAVFLINDSLFSHFNVCKVGFASTHLEC